MFSALPRCPAVSGMPKTDNLLPRDASCPLTASWDSVASHNQTPTLGQVKSVRQSPTSAQPENQNAGGTWVSSLSLYFPYSTSFCIFLLPYNIDRYRSKLAHSQASSDSTCTYFFYHDDLLTKVRQSSSPFWAHTKIWTSFLDDSVVYCGNPGLCTKWIQGPKYSFYLMTLHLNCELNKIWYHIVEKTIKHAWKKLFFFYHSY